MVRMICNLASWEGPSSGPRWGLLQRLGEVAGHTDPCLAVDAASPDGFRLLGNLPPHLGWPVKVKPDPALSHSNFLTASQKLLEEHKAERSRGHYRLPTKHADALYQMLHDQSKKGFWQEYSVSAADEMLGGFASWLFFAVEEVAAYGSKKLRGCLSPEAANGPDMVHLPNQVYMAGLDGYLATCAALADSFAKEGRNPKLQGWKEDYTDGFRQIPLSSEDRRFLCALGRAPNGEVRVFVPLKLLFGPRGGPHVFCRVTDKVAAVCSVLLLAPTAPHVDDLCGVEEEGGTTSAREAVLALHKALNLQLGQTKAVPDRNTPGGANQLIVLGGDVAFPQAQAERLAGLVAKVDLPACKAAKYDRQIASTLNSGQLTSAEAGKVVGRWDFASAVALGRSGRAFTWPLRNRARDHSPAGGLHRLPHFPQRIWEHGSAQSRRDCKTVCRSLRRCCSPRPVEPSWRHRLGPGLVQMVFH